MHAARHRILISPPPMVFPSSYHVYLESREHLSKCGVKSRGSPIQPETARCTIFVHQSQVYSPGDTGRQETADRRGLCTTAASAWLLYRAESCFLFLTELVFEQHPSAQARGDGNTSRRLFSGSFCCRCEVFLQLLPGKLGEVSLRVSAKLSHLRGDEKIATAR